MENYDYYITNIENLLKENPRGMTVSEISQELSMSRNTVGKYLELMYLSGKVEVRVVGKAKLYYLSSRVPVTQLLNYSSDAVVQTDDQYRIQSMNLGAVELFEITREGLIGQNILDIFRFSAGDPKITEAIISRDRPAAFSCEMEFRKRTSVRFLWMKLIDTVMYDGSPGRIFMFEDVTDWKRAEEELKESEYLYRTLAESSQDLIFIVTPDNRYEYVNSKLAEELEVNPKDLIGQSRDRFFSPDEAAHMRENNALVLTTKKPVRKEVQVHLRERTRWFDEMLIPLFHNGENVRGIFVIAREVTDQKEAQRAKYHLASLVEYSDAAIISRTLDGTVLSWNHGAEKISGYSPEEMIGKPIFTVIQKSPAEDVKDISEKVLRGEGVMNYKAVMKRKDGQKKDISLTVSSIVNEENTVIGVSLIGREL
ncbi:MAG: PAS domain S-box protein [Methanospirillaceae archaeon]|nr:PAS domain S-box protein [Methanospirillaceae archaeon]